MRVDSSAAWRAVMMVDSLGPLMVAEMAEQLVGQRVALTVA